MVNDKSKYFVFNGKKSSDFGVWASGSYVLDSPMKRYEQIDVPGRNGTLIIEDGSYENVNLEFKDCWIPEDFPNNYSALKNFLYRQKGYQRLELSWLPDEYRLAAFMGDIEPTITSWNGKGHFDMSFNCKPQRFLKSGEDPIYIIPLYHGESTIRLTDKFQKTGMKITLLKMPESGSVSFSISYGDDDTETGTYSIGTATEVGWTYTLESSLPESDWWRIIATLGQDDDPDDFMYMLECNFSWGTLSGQTERIMALCGRSIDIENPTGFSTSPYIEVNGAIFPIQYITNYDEDGNEEEYWNIICSDYSEVTTSATIDCENEYFFYDDNGKKKNITGHLTIQQYSEETQAYVPSMTFPKFGSHKINIYTYLLNATFEDVFVKIYPRWFTI